jgi:hypothetical protein
VLLLLLLKGMEPAAELVSATPKLFNKWELDDITLDAFSLTVR